MNTLLILAEVVGYVGIGGGLLCYVVWSTR